MKTNHYTSILAAFVTLLFAVFNLSCQPESTEMSEVEKETAKKEISARIDEIVQGANTLDIEAAIKPYADVPDFLIVSPDGSVADYQTMKKVQTEFFDMAASNTFTTQKEDFRFLTKTLVICTWHGSNAFVLKSGERFNIPTYVGSMLFSKTDGEWRIIYAHESASPPVQEAASTLN